MASYAHALQQITDHPSGRYSLIAKDRLRRIENQFTLVPKRWQGTGSIIFAPYRGSCILLPTKSEGDQHEWEIQDAVSHQGACHLNSFPPLSHFQRWYTTVPLLGRSEAISPIA